MRLAASVSAVRLRQRSAWPIYGLLVVLAVVLGLLSPQILSLQNLINILNQQVSLALVTMGQALVVLTGGLDLSVGSVVSMTTAIASYDTAYSVPLALLAAGAVGVINALGIIRFKIHPILMTLSTMTAVQGVAQLIRPIPGGQVPGWLSGYANATLLGIPAPVILAALALAAASIVVGRSRFGLRVLATGSSPENARLGGIDSNRIIALAYLASALLACLGGLNLAGRLASGDPLVGLPFAIDSIAATALGGTLLSGGMGGMLGPVAGVIFLALLGNGLNFMNVSTYYQMIVKGVLLVIAVSAHRRSIPGL